MKPTLRMALSAACLLVSCGNVEVQAGGAAPDAAAPKTIRGDSTGWDSVSSEDGDTTLVVAFVGGPKGDLTEPCQKDYEVDLQESANEVIVTVFRRELSDPPEQDQVCLAAGHPWEIEAEMAQPLGDRVLIDGHDATVRVPNHRDQAAPPPPQDNPIETTTTQGGSDIAVAGNDGAVGAERYPEVQTYADQFDITYEEAVVELNTQAALMNWADSARLEPWYDGFRLERGRDGMYGVVLLNPEVEAPDLPTDLPLRSTFDDVGFEFGHGAEGVETPPTTR